MTTEARQIKARLDSGRIRFIQLSETEQETLLKGMTSQETTRFLNTLTPQGHEAFNKTRARIDAQAKHTQSSTVSLYHNDDLMGNPQNVLPQIQKLSGSQSDMTLYVNEDVTGNPPPQRPAAMPRPTEEPTQHIIQEARQIKARLDSGRIRFIQLSETEQETLLKGMTSQETTRFLNTLTPQGHEAFNKTRARIDAQAKRTQSQLHHENAAQSIPYGISHQGLEEDSREDRMVEIEEEDSGEEEIEMEEEDRMVEIEEEDSGEEEE